jgi:polysaccharide deacetylase family protein (PEP-CTERM system associated)
VLGQINAFSIDVEDWFQVSAFASHIDPAQWQHLPCRVERNVDLLLGMLEAADVRATFFTLGWIGERYPATVRKIVAAGHELANHGYAHQRASDQSREDFRQDLARARDVLEQAGGVRVIGYRAPSFSIGESNPWAHDVVLETGHTYSSSVYPVAHDHYGVPDAPRFAHRLPNGLVEIPPSTIRWGGRNWAIGGGGWFRLLPYRVSAWGLRRINSLDRRPAVVYYHPWEFDPGQPRVSSAPLRSRFRHYLNLSRTEPRIRQLLRDFRWDRIDRVFAGEIAAAPGLRAQPAPALRAVGTPA